MNSTDIVNQLNTLAVQSAQTVADAALLAQKQNVQALQAIVTTIEANQQTAGRLTARLVEQTREAQQLWLSLLSGTVPTAATK